MKRILFLMAMLIGVVYGQAQSIGYLRYDSVRIQKIGGNGELIIENGTRNVTGGVLTNTGNGRTGFIVPPISDSVANKLTRVYRKPGTDSVFYCIYNSCTFAYKDTIGAGGGSVAALAKEGLTKRSDTLVIDNNRNIYYITQPTTGSSIPSIFTAVGTPGLTFSNGTWIWASNANNNTQYIRSNAGVLSEGCYIEGYVIIDSVRASSIGPGLVFKSYNPFASGAYTHDVEFRYVTGSSATNYGKITIYGKTGNSTNASDSARVANIGDTLYYRADRDGLAYTFRVENITQDWKLYNSVQCTPAGSPFVPHNSSYVAFSPGGGGYKTYGFRYVDKAPIQTELVLNGNSITMRQGSSSEGAGYSSLVGNPVNNIVMGGGADGISEMLKRVGEIIAIKPKAVLMEAPGNDILFDGSLTTTTKNEYIEFRDSIVAHGIAFIHTLPTPRTATDVSALKNWIDTTTAFRSDLKIDLWTPLLGSGTSLNSKYDADGTHPNDAGHAQMASTINIALHRNNNEALYATKNIIARNGYVFSNDAGTGPDQNKSGAWIAALSNSTTQYMHGGFYSDYGWINAISEGTAYRDIGISTAGSAKFFVGSAVNRTAKLNVTDGTNGNTEIFAMKHGGSFSAVGQASQMAWYNGTSTKTGMIANVVGTGSMFDLAFHTYNSAINTTPALYLQGDNKIKLANVPFKASMDTVLYWDPSDSVLKRTLITGGGGSQTFQQTLTTGSTLTGNNTVDVGTNDFTWDNADDFTIEADSLFLPSLGQGFDTTVNKILTFNTVTKSLRYAPWLYAGSGGAGTDINNQFGSQQNARFWINGAGESDSSLRGRTTGASSGFKTGGLIAYGAGTSRTSYLQFGYDNTLACGWFQSVTEGSAYRDLIMNAAGGNLGLGTLTAAPTTLLQLQKNNYPAIKLLKTGVNPWYIGNRTEGSGTDFLISYNTTDWIRVKITGETGIGAVDAREVLDVNGVISVRTVNAAAAASKDSVAVIEDGRIKTLHGEKIGALVPLAELYTTVSNSGTSETDLFTKTIPANTLTANGQKIIMELSGEYNDATGVERMRSYFAGNSIFDEGSIAGNPGSWKMTITFIRTGTTTARASVSLTADAVIKPAVHTDVTGLDFTTTNILKITGTSSQNVTDAITAKVGTMDWKGVSF